MSQKKLLHRGENNFHKEEEQTFTIERKTPKTNKQTSNLSEQKGQKQEKINFFFGFRPPTTTLMVVTKSVTVDQSKSLVGGGGGELVGETL